MENINDFLENLWDNLLSRESEKVCAAFAALDAAEQQSVYAHIERMASEPGWHPEQQLSARAALDALIKRNLHPH
jgi:hypothetical protein